VVKYGYCRGQEPFNYVRNIIKKYFDYQSKINLTSATQTAGEFRLEQVQTTAFDGLEGVYNPTQGLIARSARRELFLSHKLFDEETELIPKDGGRNPFDKPKKNYLCANLLLHCRIRLNNYFRKKSVVSTTTSLLTFRITTQ
jgi:hypothetical protein